MSEGATNLNPGNASRVMHDALNYSIEAVRGLGKTTYDYQKAVKGIAPIPVDKATAEREAAIALVKSYAVQYITKQGFPAGILCTTTEQNESVPLVDAIVEVAKRNAEKAASMALRAKNGETLH